LRSCRLSLGSRGEGVRELQERLRGLGYDPGTADGHFGYLTNDAVKVFQRDHGLRVDGVAGPEVWSALKEGGFPGSGFCVLAAGESLDSVAHRLGYSPEVLRHINRLGPRSRGYAGQRLYCRPHYVVGVPAPGSRGLHAAGRVLPHLSALASTVAVIREGNVELGQLDPEMHELARRSGLELWLGVTPAAHLEGEPHQTPYLSVLPGNRRLQEAAQGLLEMARLSDAGLWLDIGRPQWGDGPRLLRLARCLREALPNDGRSLMISLPLPGARAHGWWLTDIDYRALAKTADKVVLAAHYPGAPESFAVTARRLHSLLRVVPPWKSLLGISLRAEERDSGGRLLRELSYSRALTAAYVAGSRPRWDAGRGMRRAEVAADSPDEGRVFWLLGGDAAAERFGLVHRLRLAGALLWPLGEEDTRVWNALSRRLRPWRSGD
jgi:hypothetical protein